jgi:hypothetical protein
MLTRTLLALAFFAAAFTSRAYGDSWYTKAIVTFDAPVAVGGQTLQPGKYLFRRVENLSHRTVIRVENLNSPGEAFFIRGLGSYTAQPAEKVMVEMVDRGSGAPPAVKTIRFAGDPHGVYFIPAVPSAEERLAKKTVSPAAQTTAD